MITISNKIVTGLAGGMASVLAIISPSAALAQPEVPPVYIGTVSSFAFGYCPSDYLPADGRKLSIKAYNDLFSLFGFLYGGDGVTTFALPDLRDKSIVGSSQNNTLGKTIGQSEVLLNINQVPIPTHTHQSRFIAQTAPLTITVPEVKGSLKIVPVVTARQVTGIPSVQSGSFLAQGGIGQNSAPIYAPSSTTASSVELGGVSVTVTGTAGTVAVSSPSIDVVTGGQVVIQPAVGRQALDTVITQSPAVALTICIAAKGYFPQRQ